jgi:uncharacterized protein (DUF58 family)
VLTRRGWLLAATAVGFAIAGRLLGIVEAYVAAASCAMLVAFAVVGTSLTRLRLEVAREVHPQRVHAGTPSRVDVMIRNRGRGRSPVLRIDDSVSGTRGARLYVPPLDAGTLTRAAYRLPTERRGVIDIGPLQVTVGDAFGLAETRLAGAPVTELTVYPRIDAVLPPPHTTGDDPYGGADHPNSLARTGEDFYALRPYVVGDDLRRVHWRATAHHDDLMVRQDELPWQGRVTMLLDVRRATMPAPALEVAVSAAASIVDASWRRENLVRMVATDGTDSGFAAGNAAIDGVMEYLATVDLAEEAAFRRTADRLSRSASGGALVVLVSGDLPEREVEVLARLRRRFGWLTVLSVERSAWDTHAPTETVPAKPPFVRITRDRPFVAAWESALRSRRGVARVTR